MTESIGSTIVALAASVGVSLYLSEAQTEEYPYAVYDYTPVFHSTKDGVYKVMDDNVELHVFDKSLSNASAKLESIVAAVLQGMNGNGFRASHRSSAQSCTEGVWDTVAYLSITQIIS